MPDWPIDLTTPAFWLSTVGPSCLDWDYAYTNNQFPSAGAVWPAANRAIYAAVMVERTCVAYRFGVRVTTQAGNLDVGIYDEDFNRIVSKGSTAVAVAGLQVIDLTASVTGTASPTLKPGIYFLALSCSSATAAFQRASHNAEALRVCGVQQEGLGAVTLPAVGTPANPASAYIPAMTVALANIL
jgi:hypothetical protein